MQKVREHENWDAGRPHEKQLKSNLPEARILYTYTSVYFTISRKKYYSSTPYANYFVLFSCGIYNA